MKKQFTLLTIIVFLIILPALSFAQGDNCASAVQITTNGTYTADGPSSGGGATAGNANNADWYYFVAPSAGEIEVSACNLDNVDTRLRIHDGNCTSLNQLAMDDDGCNTYDYASVISNLVVTAGTTYYIEWDDRWSQSGFQFTFTFTSYGTCPLPTNLNASNITQTTASLSWTELGSATTWIIEYDTAGFTLGTGTLINNVTNNPYSLSGLSASTAYDFYVRSFCAIGDTSVWAGPFQFHTSCLPVLAPYYENFENTGLIPTCWTNDVGDDIDWSFGQNTPSNTTGPSGDHTTGSGYFAYTEASNPNFPDKRADLLSPWIDVTTLSVPAIHFWHHLYGADMGELHVDIHDGTSWTNDIFQISGDQGDFWDDQYIDISAYGDTVQIRFRGITGDMAFSDMAIDDFSVVEMPTCPDPDSLDVANIQSTSAEISWHEIGSATNWNIQYGNTGFSLGTGTTVSTTNNPENIIGLAASTSYDVYVQSDCGLGDTSNWVGPLSFTTACAVYTAPYTEDFENAGNIPICWTNDIGDDIDWSFGQNTPSFNTGPSGDHTTGSGYFAFTEASQPNYPNKQADMLSPWVDISGLSSPSLSFWYHMYGVDMGSLHLDINDGTGWTNDVFQIAGEQGNFWTQTYVDLSAFADTIQVRFRGITGTYAYSDMAIDDVLIDEMPSCIPPSMLSITNLTDSSASLGWTEIGSATEWNIEYGPSGFIPGTGTIIYNVTNNPYTLSGLTASTDYDFYVQSYCSIGDSSAWSGPKTFSTLMDPLTNPSLCEINISIPDPGCIDIPINVQNIIGNQLGTDIELSDVSIIIEHTADMDLSISLESPNGVVVDLSTNNGGNGNNYGVIDGTCTQYTNFNMAGTNGNITAGNPPFTGSYIPEGNFANYDDNSNPNGLWILHICDAYGTDTGAVQYIEIIFNSLIPPADVIINEVDCDQATDTLEFIELYDGGVGNYPLTGYALALYNGTTDQIYYSIDLDGYTTDSSGYFVLGNNAVNQASINFPDGLLQNGADAVALYFDDATNLAVGSPISLTNLSDALVYGTNDPVDIQLLALLNMGQPQINEDNKGNKDLHSCSRLPNGSGGLRNTATYDAAIPTPAAKNHAIPDLIWGTTFTESLFNDGSIDNTLSVELEGTQFAVLGALTENTHYTLANLPTGLTAIVNTLNDSVAEIQLNGNALAHANANDISNLSVNFLNAAFDQYANFVMNKSKADIIIDFIDNAPKTLVWDTDTFYENVLNDGSIGNPINLMLFSDTFAIVDTLVQGVHYTVNNLPAGLSTHIETLSDTTAIIQLTGNALSHFDSDDMDSLDIRFLDAVFIGGVAANIIHYADSNLVIDYLNQPSDSTEILAYSFPQQSAPAVIDPINHTVDISVVPGTSLSYLVATFTLSGGATATVYSSTQTSGISFLDFTFPVTYNVLAEDSVTNQDWVITVTVDSLPKDSTDIITYSFPQQTSPAVINDTNHTVHIEVAYGTSLTALTASYTLSTGATATILGVPQQSGVSVNDFSSTVIYNVLAEDTVTNQDWSVYVTIASAIEDQLDDFTVDIYPNPTTNNVNIEIHSNIITDFVVQFYDVKGQLISNKTYNKCAYVHDKYDINSFPKGVYYVKILDGKQLKVQKIIIQ